MAISKILGGTDPNGLSHKETFPHEHHGNSRGLASWEAAIAVAHCTRGYTRHRPIWYNSKVLLGVDVDWAAGGYVTVIGSFGLVQHIRLCNSP